VAPLDPPARNALLVPTNELGWSSVREQLRWIDGIQVVETSDGPEAVRLAADTRPGLALIARTPRGAPAPALLAGLWPAMDPPGAIFVLGSHFTPEEIAPLYAGGVTGCLDWDDLTTDLLQDILALAACGRFAVWSRSLYDALRKSMLTPEALQEVTVTFTDRELAMLDGLSQGHSHKQIAASHFLSERTVRRSMTQLRHKLEARNAFVLGLRAGLAGFRARS
jgi:DNA-binding NarL/FixJ family response regulator